MTKNTHEGKNSNFLVKKSEKSEIRNNGVKILKINKKELMV